MLTNECLHELRSAWLPHITDTGLNRLIELLAEGSPFLTHGCFTRDMPIGCLATHAAWHHPATAHLTQDAGIVWLHRIAGLNPATSHLLRAWDRHGVRDLDLCADLQVLFEQERNERRQVEAPCEETVAVS